MEETIIRTAAEDLMICSNRRQTGQFDQYGFAVLEEPGASMTSGERSTLTQMVNGFIEIDNHPTWYAKAPKLREERLAVRFSKEFQQIEDNAEHIDALVEFSAKLLHRSDGEGFTVATADAILDEFNLVELNALIAWVLGLSKGEGGVSPT